MPIHRQLDIIMDPLKLAFVLFSAGLFLFSFAEREAKQKAKQKADPVASRRAVRQAPWLACHRSRCVEVCAPSPERPPNESAPQTRCRHRASHELFSVIYTNYRSYFPSTQHLRLRSSISSGSKLQVLWILCVLVFYRSTILMNYGIPRPSDSFYFLGSCAKVRHSSRTTRRLLVEACPSCCLLHYMEMEHPFLELESHGFTMGDFFSWSCLLMSSGHSQLTRFMIFMVHAYMRCPNRVS